MAFDSAAQVRQYSIRILLSSLVVAGGVYAAYTRLPAPQPRMESWQGKVMYTLRWQLFSFFTMVVCVAVVAFTRLFTPALNPLNPKGNEYVETSSRILQNTMEQLVLCVPAQLILSSYLESESLRIIPILVVLFVIGRLLFWLGYPMQRVYGFVMTFPPTFIVYVVDIFFFYQAGPGFRLSEA